MNKNNHNAIAQEVIFIINKINRASEEEIKNLYGIELIEDGKVYDTAYDKTFDSVNEWALFNLEQDDMEYEEHFYGKSTGEY